MRAKTLIKRLQECVEKHGNIEVWCDGDYNCNGVAHGIWTPNIAKATKCQDINKRTWFEFDIGYSTKKVRKEDILPV